MSIVFWPIRLVLSFCIQPSMNFEEFESSLNGDNPPAGLSPYLTALWHERRGDWNKAHEIVQDINSTNAAWIHAYLHRQEGDNSNARYWYGIAGKSFPANASLNEEWESLVNELL